MSFFDRFRKRPSDKEGSPPNFLLFIATHVAQASLTNRRLSSAYRPDGTVDGYVGGYLLAFEQEAGRAIGFSKENTGLSALGFWMKTMSSRSQEDVVRDIGRFQETVQWHVRNVTEDKDIFRGMDDGRDALNFIRTKLKDLGFLDKFMNMLKDQTANGLLIETTKTLTNEYYKIKK